MTTSKYILTSSRFTGRLIVTYHNGFIFSFINEFKTLTEQQWDAILQQLPAEDKNISCVESIGLVIKKDKTNEKITLFCNYYKQHVKDKDGNPIRYDVSGADSGKIINKEVTDELLKCYFCSANFLWKNRYSISNYVKYYNELRAECFGAKENAPPPQRFKDHYDRKYEQTLTGPALSEYWAHLRSLGFMPVKNGRNEVTDWQKPTTP